MDIYQTLDLGDKIQGNIWNRKPLPHHTDGKFLCIKHTLQGKVSTLRQHLRFLHSCIDVSGERIVLGDHQGNIFLLDLEKNRFSTICKIGQPSTAIAWNHYRINEILVALVNFEVRCYNVVSHELVSVLKCHTSPVHSISIHASGQYALTSSFDTTILWDLNTFMKKRTLHGAQQVGVQQVFFLPNSNKMVSCFKDDSIFVWECENMKCLYQLTPLTGGGVKPGYKCLTTTKEGTILVAAGRSRFVHIWNLETRQLIQILELPSSVKEVKDVQFLDDGFTVRHKQLLVILAQDGVLRFVEPHQCELEAEIGGGNQRIHSFSLSINMRYLITVMDSGDVGIHLLSTILKPRDMKPLLQKVKEPSKNKKNIYDKENHVPSVKCRKTTEKYTDKEMEKDSLTNQLDMKRLKKVLRGYGEYPAKYRLFIWRRLLCLPENHVAFSALLDKGTHNAFEALQEKYPIKSRKLFRVLQRVLSALAHWSNIFGETDYLPMIVFPMIRMFPNNQLVCFEIIASLLLNWCQQWFEYFPNPPLTVLSMVEKLLGYHDPPLLQHFIKLNISTQTYAWPMLYTLFSEVLTKEQWLIAWDNIFSNHPSFLYYFLISYLICSRHAIFSCKSEEDFEFYFHHRNALDIPTVIKEAYRLYNSTPKELHTKHVLKDFHPLTEHQYPVFDCYPKFVVDYLVGERERIREEELEYLRQKQEAITLKKQRELTRREELTYYREQNNIMKAEQYKRQLIAAEEEKLAVQRRKLSSFRRDMALDEIEVLDEVRREHLNHQRLLKEIELQGLDDELKKKMRLREDETKAALADAEIHALELEVKKRNFDERQLVEKIDATQKAKLKNDMVSKQQQKQHAHNDREDHTMKKLSDSNMSSSNSHRGSFNNTELDLMYQVRNLRRKVAQTKAATVK